MFLLKSKDEAFNTFVTWKKLIENQTRCKIKKLRTDNGYPNGVKGCKLWCLEPGYKKCIINRDAVINEDEMTMVKKTDITSTQEARSSRPQIEVDSVSKFVIDESQDDLDESTTTKDAQTALRGYQLTRDSERRITKAPKNYGYTEFTSFALSVAKDLESLEPKSYLKAITEKDGVKWLQSIKEENVSFEKNKTWIIVKRLIRYDILIIVKDRTNIDKLKSQLKSEFEMRNIYLKKVVEKFGMTDAKPVATPLAQDFKLSQEKSPKIETKRRKIDDVPYASGVGTFINFKENVTCYVDSNYAANLDTRRSLTRYVFTVFGGYVSWKSNLQKVVALSSTEAAYMAATKAIKKIDELIVDYDNQSAIHLMKNYMFHERSKHVDIKLYFIRDIIVSKEI
uniref:Polyprotein n=1 Tax=Cannabis sativa TaxID=3483 RepID=A0A803NJW2_CANSA